MQVHLFDVNAPDSQIGSRFTFDTSLGVPVIGDDIYLKARGYDDIKKSYLAGTVRQRRWIFSDSEPTGAILQIWVQRHGG